MTIFLLAAMIPLVVLKMSGFAFLRRNDRQIKEEREDAIGSTLALIVPVFFAACFVCYCATAILCSDAVIEQSTPLAAVSDSDQLKGSFILGSGSISNQKVYNYYTVNENGSVSPGSISASPDVSILQDSELKDKGFITVYKTGPSARNLYYLKLLGLPPEYTYKRTELRVPVGTVRFLFAVR